MADVESIQSIDYTPRVPGKRFAKSTGRPKNSVNLYSKQPSSIATRLKAAGVDWVVDLAVAIKSNNETRINTWLRLLPYLIVTQGHRKIKRSKGRASKAALIALEALESKPDKSGE
jgi:hypothetical protein